jgi:NADPH:quinone reductase-like Zn-dependent oxidoreductase
VVNIGFKIKELTNDKGVDIIIDFVGRDYWKNNIDSLAIDGRMVILAYLSGRKHSLMIILTCNPYTSKGPDIENMHISDFVIKRISVNY